MEQGGSITQLILDFQAGRRDAATQLWERYHYRMVHLAAQRLRATSRRVADEEDVVIDAFESFCKGVKAGRFPRLDDRHDLWQVLMMLTARKAVNQAKLYRREKRGGGRVRGDSVFIMDDDERAGIAAVVGSEPTPEFSAQIGEECQRLLAALPDETMRQVALAKLDGYTNAEIGEKLQTVERTIERKLRIIREIWSNCL